MATKIVRPRTPAHRPPRGVRAAYRFIESQWTPDHGGYFPCETDRCLRFSGAQRVAPELFTAAVIADVLLSRGDGPAIVGKILEMLRGELTGGILFFFKEHERLPADVDCTALGVSVLLRGRAIPRETAHRTLDRIVENTEQSGVVQTYFDPGADRLGIVDPVACANVLALAGQLGRLRELQPTLELVRAFLRSQAYLHGTRYYHGPDSFLYALARFVQLADGDHSEMRQVLRAELRGRPRTDSCSLSLSQRAIARAWLGVDHTDETSALAERQREDGGWPPGALFRYGRSPVYFGSRVLTTSFAAGALWQRFKPVYWRTPALHGVHGAWRAHDQS